MKVLPVVEAANHVSYPGICKELLAAAIAISPALARSSWYTPRVRIDFLQCRVSRVSSIIGPSAKHMLWTGMQRARGHASAYQTRGNYNVHMDISTSHFQAIEKKKASFKPLHVFKQCKSKISIVTDEIS